MTYSLIISLVHISQKYKFFVNTSGNINILKIYFIHWMHFERCYNLAVSVLENSAWFDPCLPGVSFTFRFDFKDSNGFIFYCVYGDHSLSNSFLFWYIHIVNYCCISIFSLVFLFLHNGFMVHWTEMTKMKDFQDFFRE